MLQIKLCNLRSDFDQLDWLDVSLSAWLWYILQIRYYQLFEDQKYLFKFGFFLKLLPYR